MNFFLSVSVWPPVAPLCSTPHGDWREMTKKDAAQWRGCWSSRPAPSGLSGLEMSRRGASPEDSALWALTCRNHLTHWRAELPGWSSAAIYFCQVIYPGNLYLYSAEQPEGNEWHSEESFTNIYTSCLGDMSISTTDLRGNVSHADNPAFTTYFAGAIRVGCPLTKDGLQIIKM